MAGLRIFLHSGKNIKIGHLNCELPTSVQRIFKNPLKVNEINGLAFMRPHICLAKPPLLVVAISAVATTKGCP